MNINPIRRGELTELFLDLVKIDSESGNEDEIRQYIVNKLLGLNIETEVDGYGNLIARLPGVGEPLILAAHMDTVQPGKGVVPVVVGDKISSDGNTVLGADDKAGLATIIYALTELQKLKGCHRTIEAVFTREEETGCIGAANLNYSLLAAKEALVLDHTAKPGKIVMGAPFLSDIFITIKGRASHASKPENGINAIAVAAMAISKLRVGRIDKETTSNIGVINGGIITNGVPEVVRIQAEVRSHNKSKHDKWLEIFEEHFKAAGRKFGAEVLIEKKQKVAGYTIDKKDTFYKKIKVTWHKLGIETLSEKIGGASDANVFNLHGLKAIPLGSGGQHCHTTAESIDIIELENLARFILAFTTLK